MAQGFFKSNNKETFLNFTRSLQACVDEILTCTSMLAASEVFQLLGNYVLEVVLFCASKLSVVI